MFAFANIFFIPLQRKTIRKMKKVLFVITASTLLLCGCLKQQCRNTIYNNCSYHNTVIYYVDGKQKTIDAGEKKYIPYLSNVVLDNKNYLIQTCGESWIISDTKDRIYMQ